MDGKRAATGDIPGESSTTRDRVMWLLKFLWDGNRSAMAREVGFSHTAIFKFVNGKRAPSRGLLAAIAEHPKVNGAWVRHGTGEPLLTDLPQSVAIPISENLLAQFPSASMPLVPADVFRWPGDGSSYLFRCWGNELIALDEREKIMKDDMLLMVPPPGASKRDPRYFDGKICAVQRTTEGGVTILLGRISCYSEDQGSTWRLVMRGPRAIPPRPTTRDRVIQLDPVVPAEDTAATQTAPLSEECEIKSGDVVAIVVLIVRRP